MVLNIDNFLNMKPEDILEELKKHKHEELKQFRKVLRFQYNQLAQFVPMGKKQLLAYQDDPEELKLINSELLIVGATLQKIEDCCNMITAIVND